MTDADRRAHWDKVYAARDATQVSWFEATPTLSLDLIGLAGTRPGAAVVDIGGGASRLADHLLAQGYAVTVLDLSHAALEQARARLGPAADRVEWIVADVTRWTPARRYALWHDRAALHFLTDPQDQRAYVERLDQALDVGGHAILATFAPDGPEKCSGLTVARHDAESLSRLLGPRYDLAETRERDHLTPWGAMQKFQFSLFRRLA